MRFLGIAILSGMLWLFCPQVARAPPRLQLLTISIFVKTDAYEVLFVDGVITQLSNKLTEELYTLPLGIGGIPTGIRGRSGLLRKNGESFWTDRATLTTETRKINPLKAEIVCGQGQNEIRLFVAIDESTNDLLIEQEGSSDTTNVYGIQWGCANLDTKNLDLILPAQGGQIIDTTSPSTSGSFNYPEHWEAQLAIIQAKQGGFYRSRRRMKPFSLKHSITKKIERVSHSILKRRTKHLSTHLPPQNLLHVAIEYLCR